MRRWGDKIYESDSALDFFAGISDLCIKEANHLFSPEQVKQNTAWLEDIVTVIEMTLLFDRNENGTLVNVIAQVEAIKRWKDIFFKVWDAEWDDLNTRFPFHVYPYHQEHRQIVEKWFQRLTEVAEYYSEDSSDDKNLSEFTPEDLPYFSLVHLETDSGKDYSLSGYFFSDLLSWLTKEIVFVLSNENHNHAINYFQVDEVAVSVDLMAMLCGAYSCPPSVKPETVEFWQTKMTDIWKARMGEEFIELSEEEDSHYQNVMARFEKLKILAQKYPSFFAL